MTIEENIEAALMARADTLALPIAWPNRVFPASGAKPATFIECRILNNLNDRRFVKGSDPHLRQGILQLNVMAPLNGGTRTALGLAAAVAEHFPADLDLYSEGVRVRIQAAPDVSDGFKAEANWVVPVSVRFEAFA